ncbi:MAG: glutamine amidotransferase, partial [Anaerolineae bacterium]|nr:glutamine amidotransferase [Anaerolineae bacterium]
VILANVPATQLSTRRMETLDSYVRDLGGGLVMIGGPDSYGPGGYFQTPLEDTLPVQMQIRDQQRLPQLTIVYLIDRSGSMGMAGPSGVANIELAKEAIIRSIDFLQPNDRAGLVSFDTIGYWIADLQPVLDRTSLQRQIATLRASGGTDILTGMNLVAREIVNDPSERKHIILLTDGGASPNGLVELTQRLYEDSDVTTSVIAIGGGAAGFLQDMANAGNGNYHMVDTIESIPTIFTLETVLATRSYILEDTFVPALTASSPIMNGIDSAPPLLGYVATSPKQTAQVVLRGPDPYNDPILTTWQYGLGRAVAFTSDATARWAANWVTWDNFTRFWSQTVRWTITEGASNNLETRVLMEGEQARIVVDARDDAGSFLNGLDLNAAVVDPLLESNSLNLRQVAPGRYEAVFTPEEEGAYFLGVNGQTEINNQPLNLSQTTGWVMSYSPEYDIQQRGADVNLLRDIGELTGGQDMTEDPSLPFEHNLEAQSARAPLWPWLLLAAMLLLPIDIAVRRLIITRSDLQRLQAAIRGHIPAPEGPSERLSSLLGAKERGRQRAEETIAPSQTIGALRASRDRTRAEREGQPTAANTAPAEREDRPQYRPSTPSPASRPEDENVAEALLKKRRQRNKNE